MSQPTSSEASTVNSETPSAIPGTATSRNRERKPVEQRAGNAARSANPLLTAARPLLRALADMPQSLRPDQATHLKALLVEELCDFQAVCERANIRREHILAARYSLCTALDEAAQSTPWGLHTWSANSLLIQLHGENEGGEKVFHLLGRLVDSPAEHIDVIQLIYYLLSLGFWGRYRNRTDGERQHYAIRQRLHKLIRQQRGPVPRVLSPHLEPVEPGRFRMLRSIPVWVTAVVLCLTAFGIFAWYKYQLLVRAHDLEQQIRAIGNITPPPPPKTLRLAELLKDEIARGVVSVQEDARQSDVTLRGDDMFGGGRAEVNAKVLPVLDKVAGEIGKVTGKVTVIGHSDNIPIRSAKYPSNQALSEERAATVSEYLATKGVAKGRLEAIGKGDAEPLADNKTADGRAKNRRVEIIVTQ
ncbi:type VI secretion system protein TssL, long form [Pandoraea sp. NPDC090278]|uniref:type VI secretion system protein TssL, long form n=1 Tax=Pandoraea sp. NPDC090278 TaxID=3364391 RepID=UPI00383B971F